MTVIVLPPWPDFVKLRSEREARELWMKHYGIRLKKSNPHTRGIEQWATAFAQLTFTEAANERGSV